MYLFMFGVKEVMVILIKVYIVGVFKIMYLILYEDYFWKYVLGLKIYEFILRNK